MIVVIQRVSYASVTVDGNTVGKIGEGLLLLVGVKEGDMENDAKILSEKISKLRIFSDNDGKMNLSVKDVSGSVLAISNFTLLANYKKGNRPDYFGGAKPEEAKKLYNFFCDNMSTLVPTERGIFGADMKVELLNDGPVTIVMDSEVLK